MPLGNLRQLVADGMISDAEMAEINQIRQTRNRVVHGDLDHHTAITTEMIERLNEITRNLDRRLPESDTE